jgi:hypothetical protein
MVLFTIEQKGGFEVITLVEPTIMGYHTGMHWQPTGIEWGDNGIIAI